MGSKTYIAKLKCLNCHTSGFVRPITKALWCDRCRAMISGTGVTLYPGQREGETRSEFEFRLRGQRAAEAREKAGVPACEEEIDLAAFAKRTMRLVRVRTGVVLARQEVFVGLTFLTLLAALLTIFFAVTG